VVDDMSDAKATVLIVDDEPFNIEIIKEYLENESYDLRSAEDGLDAWNQLQANPEDFDLVLLDRMMPNMDGMETLARIKEHPVLLELPVILQTALASKQDIADGMKAGAYYYLTKPFEEEMLRSVVATAIEDRLRYRSAQERVEEKETIKQMLSEERHAFKTLEQAREMATMLSSLCPEPQRVVVGMSELLINAVEHGNLGITYEEKGELKENGNWQSEVERRLQLPEYADREVTIDIHQGDAEIHFTITDQGDGFDFANYLEMDPDRAFDNHGRGIAMSRMLSFDSLEYQDNGSKVIASVKL
jgi:CheY-like chemotaxis protein/anti-sigma regulatory factor (Ser/Thr protein kinase)